MTTIETLRLAYLQTIAALIATYPRQEGNRPTYEAWAASASLGTTTRRIRTKGGTDIPKGAPVLFTPDQIDDEPCVSIWAMSSNGSTRTIVAADHVSEVCRTCEGSGKVYPHPTALVVVECPSC